MREINVKELRHTTGESREVFARRLGVSWLSIFNWENGRTKPSQLAIQRLLHVQRAVERQKSAAE